MTYNIYHPDGTPHLVPDNVIDTTYYDTTSRVGIQLLGFNTPNYGAAVAQNFLQLMQSFAGANPPPDATSMVGQLWFNTSDLNLYVRINNNTSGGIANWKIVTGGGGGGGSLNTWGDAANVAICKVLTSTTLTPYVEVFDILGASIGFVSIANGDPDPTMNVPIADANGAIIGYAYPA